MDDNVESIGNLAAKIVNPWTWWHAALANPAAIGKTLPVHESEPQQGYYRVKNRDGGRDPVAIYYPEGSDELVAFRAGREVTPDAIWTWACRHPITYNAYLAAMDGKGWADDDEVVAEQVKAKADPTIGDNSGDIDPAEVLKDQIEAALKGVAAYAEIKDEATQSKALSLRNRLNELSKDADNKRDDLKRPHFEAGKAIDKIWMPIVKKAKEGADTVKAAMGAFETAKLQEARREQARQAAELAASAKAQAEGSTTAPKAEAPASAPAAPAAQVRGTYGKAASVQVKMVVTDVTDWDALYTFMSKRTEVQDLLRQLAQKATDLGHTVPGVTVEEKASVR